MVRITGEHVGRRVTVRSRTPSGSATDVVGDLVGYDDGTLRVRDRDGVEHAVALADLIAGHPVSARPAPGRVVQLERVAAAGWPAVDTEPLGEWLLRAAGGFTSRANSALAIGASGLPFPAAAERVRAWYAERGLPGRAAVVLPSPEDDAFAAAGWTPRDAVLVQTADVAGVLDALPPSPVRADVRPEPSDGWLARYTARGQVTAEGREVLTGGPRVGFAHAGDGAEPPGIGRGVVVADWLGVSAIEVDPGARGRGYGKAVTRALFEWGAANGARRAYLQVESGNRPAVALYAALGLRTHHRYRYRFAPG
ncbi:MAG: GNAT family N-acetyltransferase [Streptosporangiales bacterium]|nr:GNAT family N-acetyltransferase [Streptosporangiales bacterium]MBO0890717.1 GNAT family N-acetyltransferase [Acidothermales bacterium]